MSSWSTRTDRRVRRHFSASESVDSRPGNGACAGLDLEPDDFAWLTNAILVRLCLLLVCRQCCSGVHISPLLCTGRGERVLRGPGGVGARGRLRDPGPRAQAQHLVLQPVTLLPNLVSISCARADAVLMQGSVRDERGGACQGDGPRLSSRRAPLAALGRMARGLGRAAHGVGACERRALLAPVSANPLSSVKLLCFAWVVFAAIASATHAVRLGLPCAG